jgi:hypothetical protein
MNYGKLSCHRLAGNWHWAQSFPIYANLDKSTANPRSLANANFNPLQANPKPIFHSSTKFPTSKAMPSVSTEDDTEPTAIP